MSGKRLHTDLLPALREGDHKVYKEIFDLHYKPLVIHAYQILKDTDVARDAVQEVFLELWKNRKKMHDGIIIFPYLKRAVINRSLNILKSRKHHMSAGPEPLNFLKDKGRNPEESTEDMEFKKMVMRAIQKMPDRCRAVFMLCRIEGKSHAEISSDLGISPKTIENQMTKALKLLRKELLEFKRQTMILVVIIPMLEWGNSLFELLL